MPASVDAAEAATLVLSWMTAYQSYTAQRRCSEHSAYWCMELPVPSVRRCSYSAAWRGSNCGALPTGGTTRPYRELGAIPIDYQREDFTRVVPGGFDVVFDGIGEDG